MASSLQKLLPKRNGNFNGTFSAGTGIPVIEARDGFITGISTKASAVAPPAPSTTVITETATGDWSGTLELGVYQNGKTVTVCIGNSTTLSCLNGNVNSFTSQVGYCPPPNVALGGAANLGFQLPSGAGTVTIDAGRTLRLVVNQNGSISIRGMNFVFGPTSTLVFLNFPICFTYIAE